MAGRQQGAAQPRGVAAEKTVMTIAASRLEVLSDSCEFQSRPTWISTAMRPGVAVDSATWAAASAERRRRPGGTRFAVSLSRRGRSPSAARSPGRMPPAAASPRRASAARPHRDRRSVLSVPGRAELALELVPELSGQEGVAALAQAGLELRALRRYLLGGLSRIHGQQLGELDLRVQPAPAGFQAQALGGDVGRFLAAFRGAPSSFSLAATLASCGVRVSAAAALAWMSTAVP